MSRLSLPSALIDCNSMILIDGAHCTTIMNILSNNQSRLDYQGLRDLFDDVSPVTDSLFYSLDKMSDGEASDLRPLFDWLTYNSFNVVAQEYSEDELGNNKARARNHLLTKVVTQVVHDVFLRHNKKIETVFLLSGDSVWSPMLDLLLDEGINVVTVAGLSQRARKSLLDANNGLAEGHNYVPDYFRRRATHHLYLSDVIAMTKSGRSDSD